MYVVPVAVAVAACGHLPVFGGGFRQSVHAGGVIAGGILVTRRAVYRLEPAAVAPT